jgi:hypothetical protein
MFICPTCNVTGRTHYTTCNTNNVSKDDFKLQTIQHTFPLLDLSSSAMLFDLYITQQYSLPEFRKHYSISYSTTLWLLAYFNIPIRTRCEANNTDVSKRKRSTTCLTKYGSTNPLSKGTMPYHTRNNTVKQKYSVTNVFQIQSIIDSINDIMIAKYGVKRIVNVDKIIDTKSKWSDEFKQQISKKIKHSKAMMTDEMKNEINQKRLITLSKNQPRVGMLMPNKFESKISQILTMLNIPHTFSTHICGRQFDFKIHNTNILIECNGDYWHANPHFYHPDDCISYPCNKKLAQDIWKADYAKHKLAVLQKFDVIYIYEHDIKKKSDEYICTFILNQIADISRHRQLNLEQQHTDC